VTRARALDVARILFVLLTLGCAWLGFRGRWDEIADAIADTSAVGLAASLLLTMVGLGLTALLWRRLLARLGSPVPERPASAIFLVGQLGKYIPGSIWSFAAQAQLGRRHQVPARRSVAASGLFLLLHTATGVVVGTAAAVVGVLDVSGPRWLWALGLVAGVVLLLPPVVRRIGAFAAGEPVEFDARDLGQAAGLMAGVWLAYGVGVLALLGPSRADASDLAVVVSAFALSHVAGVLLVIAPAGLGAREGVLIALLRPVVGLDAAIATALLARVVHAAADFSMAGLAALRARRTDVHSSPGLRPADRRTDPS
jgi:uncharacterized membrane protein YbhN (UPF0104 family)